MTALNLCNKQNVQANETIVPYITFLIRNISVFFFKTTGMYNNKIPQPHKERKYSTH